MDGVCVYHVLLCDKVEKRVRQRQTERGGREREQREENIDVNTITKDLLTGGGLILQMPDFSAIGRIFAM